MRLRMLKLCVGKGRQVMKQLCLRSVLQYYATVATERTGYICALQRSSLPGVHVCTIPIGEWHSYYNIVLIALDAYNSKAIIYTTNQLQTRNIILYHISTPLFILVMNLP